MNTEVMTALLSQRQNILSRWSVLTVGDAPEREVLVAYTEIYNALLLILANGRSAEQDERLAGSMESFSAVWLQCGYSQTEVLNVFFRLRDVLVTVLERTVEDKRVLIDQVTALQKLIDHIVISYFEVLIRFRERTIVMQQAEIGSMSLPIMKLWDGVLSLSIIGALDHDRMATILASLLHAMEETHYPIVIADISALSEIDGAIAYDLVKVSKAIALMGGVFIVSGVGPYLARSVVNQGIDISSIITKSTLSGALRSAFGMLGQTVKKTSF